MTDEEMMLRDAKKVDAEWKTWEEFMQSDEKFIDFPKVATPFVKQYYNKIVEERPACGWVYFDAIDKAIDTEMHAAWCVLVTKERKEKYKIVRLERPDAVPVCYIL